jgi:hypothetical protein
MIVQVYWNLHKNCWSLREKATGRIVKHMANVVLRNCRFVVQEGGRQRVLRERRKNVHAFVEGVLSRPVPQDRPWVAVKYNPYRYTSFVVPGRTPTPVSTADRVALWESGSVWATGLA